MNLENYGVILKKLTHDKIELVRRWRNDPKISQFMEYREEITPEMQEKWFRKIDNSGVDFFFIIEYNGEEIGLINIRDVDFNKKTGEPGIFIWEDKYLNTGLAFRASLCIMDWAFYTLKLETLRAHILSDNKRSIQYAKARGYVLAKNQENVYNQLYIVNESDYRKCRDKLIKYIR